jgi:hypothetical protein
MEYSVTESGSTKLGITHRAFCEESKSKPSKKIFFQVRRNLQQQPIRFAAVTAPSSYYDAKPLHAEQNHEQLSSSMSVTKKVRTRVSVRRSAIMIGSLLSNSRCAQSPRSDE